MYLYKYIDYFAVAHSSLNALQWEITNNLPFIFSLFHVITFEYVVVLSCYCFLSLILFVLFVYESCFEESINTFSSWCRFFVSTFVDVAFFLSFYCTLYTCTFWFALAHSLSIIEFRQMHTLTYIIIIGKRVFLSRMRGANHVTCALVVHWMLHQKRKTKLQIHIEYIFVERLS